jgi:hypothetical protein
MRERVREAVAEGAVQESSAVEGTKILGKTAAPAVHRNIANGVTLRPKESPMIPTRNKTAYQHL